MIKRSFAAYRKRREGKEAWIDSRIDAALQRREELAPKLVLTIARLIGRQIAREHVEALQAANDNQQPKRWTHAQDDRSGDDQ